MNKIKPYWFAIAWIAFTAFLQWLGKQHFRYDSDVLQTFELWRLLTGHWVHLNWMHWLLNNLGLIMLIALLRIQWRITFWLKAILIHSIVISFCLLLLNTSLNWYVGFSGVLYGLYLLAALQNVKKEPLISVLVISIVVIKIGSEQIIGSEISTQALLGAPVIVDAHLYGVLCGAVIGALMLTKMIKIQ